MVAAWARSFLIQASWNYDRLVGIGMGFVAAPLLRSLPDGTDGARYRRAMARACAYFNSHPYLAGLAVGATARAEHDDEPGDRIERLRKALTGPLGAVGDQLIWAGLLPLTAAVGLGLAALVSPVVGVITFLGLYNAVHFAIRVWALRAGWQGGVRVAEQLRAPIIRGALRVGGRIAGLALGVAIPIVVVWLARDFDADRVVEVAVGIGVVAAAGVGIARWIWPALGTLRFGLVALAVALIGAWL